MLKEDFRMLRLRPVAGVRIHDELSIGQVLGQQERVDRLDHDILVPVHHQGRVPDLAEHREAFARRYDAPVTDRRQLGRG